MSRPQELYQDVLEAGIVIDNEGGVTGEESPERWPSVNASTAAVALDALEAELRDLLRATGIAAESQA